MTTRELITKHEAIKLFPYKDTVGKLTIGVGHNLSDNGISHKVAQFILTEDIKTAVKELKDIFEEYDSLPNPAKAVMTDMMFNLGFVRFSKFRKMIQAVKDKNFTLAAAEAEDSKWCKQVGVRCKENCAILRAIGLAT